MNAAGIKFRFRIMARGALGRRQAAGMHQLFDARVTISAIKFGMDRFLKDVGGKESHRRLFAVHHAGSRRVGMAIQAILIGYRPGRQRGGQRQRENNGETVKNNTPTCRRCGSRCIDTRDHIHPSDAQISGLVG